jgi:hypothetical protein
MNVIDVAIVIFLAILLYIPINTVVLNILALMPANAVPSSTIAMFTFGWATWPIVLILSVFVYAIVSAQWREGDTRRLI